MKNEVQNDTKKEVVGWLTLVLMMFLFPALFFLCVWFPIWVGLTETFP